MSYLALSRGVSLTGYQPGDPTGSLTTKAPSSVGIQPSLVPSGSMISSGRPAWAAASAPAGARSLRWPGRILRFVDGKWASLNVHGPVQRAAGHGAPPHVST